MSAACIGRRSPACCGRSSTTTSTWTDGWRNMMPIRCRVGKAKRRAMPSGSTCSTATSSPCRTSGNIPGMRRGTSRFIPSRLSLVDFDFAKEQLLLMLRNLYAHPNGQIPAYEWNFSDVNPPVHAWATLFLYSIEKETGPGRPPLPGALLPGLMLNFNWWVNRKDPAGTQRLRRRISRPRQHRRL